VTGLGDSTAAEQQKRSLQDVIPSVEQGMGMGVYEIF
jgi:hypothetical protein